SDLGIIIDADMISVEPGVDRIKGGKIAVERIENCLEKGINFTQETTLSGVRTLKTIQKARELNYFIRLYYVGVSSSAESISRIKNRVSKGGHDIPAKDVERRYSKRFDDLAKILPYCDEAVFFDNENGFAEKAEYKNGSLITKGGKIPQWISELDEYLSK
ncbi:MAG: zeta toxin family protein, partial [Ruminococcus sp.]|nr:zeta toxin family protein [Ruminococcus sp.]